MNVVVTIDGREAIPVRAIPFMTGWTVSPDTLVDELRGSREMPKLRDPKAYPLTERGPAKAMLPKEWDAVAADIRALSERLRTEYGSGKSEVEYSAWREQSIRCLPKAVLVWRDEFEASFQRGYNRYHWSIEAERDGDRDLTVNPVIPDNLCGAIMEGFERFLTGAEASVAPPHCAEPPAPSDREPGQPLSAAQALLLKIVEELGKYAKDIEQDFDRNAMPGPLGGTPDEEGSFHWLCAQIDPLFRKSQRQFERYRSGICAVKPFAQESDFYRRALPHMAPLFAPTTPK